ncbi:MAG TPA: hypothetical protein VMV92_11685 [Streptosporangiaceae bacterium]|nr:hypothetical protein [Streptosporangiaceae bacterium]
MRELPTNYTLGIPPASSSDPIRSGYRAKLMFVPLSGQGAPEEMWVRVDSADGMTFTGTLTPDSIPGLGKGLPSAGEDVAFEARHVFTVME